jgi:putative sterol carrier protein
MTLDDLAAVRSGSLDPMNAYFSGRIKLDGDIMLAMQLRALLGKMAS